MQASGLDRKKSQELYLLQTAHEAMASLHCNRESKCSVCVYTSIPTKESKRAARFNYGSGILCSDQKIIHLLK